MAKLEILDVIGRRINLSKKGKSYWGICPFHSEKNEIRTPSMAVNKEHQFFYCFVCNKNGDAEAFLKKFEN